MVLSTATTRHHVTKSEDSILAAADRAEPKLRRAATDMLEGLKGSIDGLTDLIAAGDVAAVTELLTTQGLTPQIVSAFQDATLTAAVASAIPDATVFNVAMNDVNIRAVRWAQQNAASEVTGIGQVSRAAVQDAIEDMLIRGLSPSQTARVIRDLVPLTTPHQQAVQRLLTSSLDAGVTAEHATKIAARKSAKLLRYRATMIARTEAVKAANMGQQLLWDTAVDQGYIAAGTRKVWLATGDDRTCKICAVMDGQTVAIDTSFNVNRQATGFIRSGADFQVADTKPLKNPTSTKVPPAHIQCRCTIVLERLQT